MRKRKGKYHDIIINSLLNYSTVKEVQENTGIRENTIYNYLKRDGFLKDLSNAKKQFTRNLEVTLDKNVLKAINTAVEIIDNVKTSQDLKLKACDLIINSTIKIKELNRNEVA